MIYHREDSIQAIRKEEQQAVQTERLAQQSVEAARIFAASSVSLSDDQALAMPELFPAWEDVLAKGKKLAEGSILRDRETLYRVVQSGGVTPQENQPPHGEGMLAVYRPIETEHAGTQEDPIPWVYGMDCRAGQYFSYEGHVYRVAEGGDMIPCVWAPGTEGVHQWEEAVNGEIRPDGTSEK